MMTTSSPSPPPSGQLGSGRGTTACTTGPCNRDPEKMRGNDGNCSYECVALHVSPDLGERVMLSGGRALLDEVFPETTQAVIDARSGVAWHQQDARHVIRFPLNGYCKLNSVQAITRLLNAGFRVIASNGGGVEGQQFSEYLFVRQSVNTWRSTAHQRKTISRSIRCLQRDYDPEWVQLSRRISQDCIADNMVLFWTKYTRSIFDRRLTVATAVWCQKIRYESLWNVYWSFSTLTSNILDNGEICARISFTIYIHFKAFLSNRWSRLCVRKNVRNICKNYLHVFLTFWSEMADTEDT